tara:strand:- start:257 stop:442 length:186 start_codon:yes stop_codon:yes gene_type:complete
MIINKIKIIIINFFLQYFAFAQVGWEDAAFGGPRDSGGEYQIIFLLIGIIFFIWFVFFSDI